MEKKKITAPAAVALLTLAATAGASLLVRASNGFFDFSVVSALIVPLAFSIAACAGRVAKRPPVWVVIIMLLSAIILCVVAYLDLRVLATRFIYDAYSYIIRGTSSTGQRPGYPPRNELLFAAIRYTVIISAYAAYLLAGTSGSRRAWLKRALVIVPYAMSMAGIYGLAAG